MSTSSPPGTRTGGTLSNVSASQRYFTTTRSVMISHLREHQANGDKVPDRTFERLEREIAEQGDEMG